jgi:hypothetical protein
MESKTLAMSPEGFRALSGSRHQPRRRSSAQVQGRSSMQGRRKTEKMQSHAKPQSLKRRISPSYQGIGKIFSDWFSLHLLN